jgi:hypothetical protein
MVVENLATFQRVAAHHERHHRKATQNACDHAQAIIITHNTRKRA